MNGERCTATSSKGKPCGAWKTHEFEYCFHHAPETAEQAREARSLGGKRRREEAALAVSFDLPSIDDPQFTARLSEIILADTLNLPNSLNRNQLLKDCWKAFSASDVQAWQALVDQLERAANWERAIADRQMQHIRKILGDEVGD